MADEVKASETEIKGTSLVPDGMVDEELPKILSRAEQEALDAKDDDNKAAGDTDKGDAAAGDSSGTDDSNAQATATNEVTAEALVTLADPGEYVPKDYSFEVQVFDAENKNPKTVKISSVDDWDALLEGDANLGSALALTKGMRLATQMESKSDADRTKYDEAKVAYDAQVQEANAQIAGTNRLLAGLNYLVDKGELPKIATKYVNADWKDPEVAKQDGVKEQIELLTYMERENKARIVAGLDPFGSVLDAWNAFVIDQAKTRAKTDKDTAGAARKEAGAKVASPAPAAMTTAPKGIAVGRGGSLRDLGNF